MRWPCGSRNLSLMFMKKTCWPSFRRAMIRLTSSSTLARYASVGPALRGMMASRIFASGKFFGNSRMSADVLRHGQLRFPRTRRRSGRTQPAPAPGPPPRPGSGPPNACAKLTVCIAQQRSYPSSASTSARWTTAAFASNPFDITANATADDRGVPRVARFPSSVTFLSEESLRWERHDAGRAADGGGLTALCRTVYPGECRRAAAKSGGSVADCGSVPTGRQGAGRRP